jgi:ABC-2 type transport system ATP-binding protein
MTYTIETNHLTKRYGPVTAVDDLALRVERGEIYAFLGLNGAGKTTTIRMLLGMIKPAAGHVAVLGVRVRPGSRHPWAAVGHLVETPHAYPELSVRENLEVVRRLHPGCPPPTVGRIIEQMGLAEYADRRAGTLSLGNAQRLGLAKALLHQPELLILDEPANGLDPAGIVEIRNLLTGLARDHGVTIFMSSHILGEVSRLADRIGIIHQGRLLQELDAAGLQRQRRVRLLVRTRNLAAGRAALEQAGYAPRLHPSGDQLDLTEPAVLERPDELAARLVHAGQAPTLLNLEQEDLEHYFLRLVGLPEQEGTG